MKEIYKKIAGFLLLMIFCGHFVSITFFTHTHVIDGATIVHSHPYKTQSGDFPSGHKHTKSGILLTHFLSDLITTVPVAFSGIAVIRIFINNLLQISETNFHYCFHLFRSSLPRAPGL